MQTVGVFVLQKINYIIGFCIELRGFKTYYFFPGTLELYVRFMYEKQFKHITRRSNLECWGVSEYYITTRQRGN
jgi:hypothetical protein